MRLSEIDKNLEVVSKIEREDLVWLNAAEAPFKIYGAVSCDPYLRLPLEEAEKVSPGVLALARHTAGVRVRFKTNSPYIAIHCEWDVYGAMPHMPVTGSSGFDIYKYINGEQKFLGTFVPPFNADKGYESIRDFGGEMTEYIINFPLYNKVDKLYIGVSRDAEFETPSEYRNSLPVIYYGSSITQGGCASRPGNCYQNFISRMFDIDYVNLGFSGSGRGEDEIIEYLASLPMSVFVSDYDHNTPTIEHLSTSHYKLYRAVRERHPDIPYVMLSAPDYKVGNADFDTKRGIIMNTFIRAKQEGDKNVYFIDGASLFADDEWLACTVDGIHPNDLGFYRFAKAMYPVMKTIFCKL